MPPAAPSTPTTAIALALAAGTILTHAPATLAQPARTTANPQQPLPDAFTGRTFQSIAFPAAPTPHKLELAATRATVWNETPPNAAAPTSRLLLERDVRIDIGPFTFNATRAVLWIEPVTVNNPDDSTTDAEQVAIYLENATGGAVPNRDTDDNAPARNTANAPRHAADRLLVTAVLTRTGATLRADDVIQRRPPLGPELRFTEQAERRLARFLDELTSATITPDPAAPTVSPRTPRDPDRLGFNFADEGFTDTRKDTPPPPKRPLRSADRGTITFRAPDITAVDDGDGATAILLEGGIGLEFLPADRRGAARLDAQRAVVFLAEELTLGAPDALEAQSIDGIYLEGDVNLLTTTGDPARADADTDHYHLRGERVYYDPKTERAVILDAVFWTYDARRGMPLYLRAEQIKQQSANQWSAERATLANAAFAEPHFSIGATSITIQRRQRPDGSTTQQIDARAVTFNAADIPLFFAPRIQGEFKPSPLRELTVGSDNGDAALKSEWDLYAILGIDSGPQNEATLLADIYTERGPAIGAELAWDTRKTSGDIFAYYLRDDGTDRLTTGARIDRDREDRALVTAETIWRPSPLWTVTAEAARVSDPAFVDAFFEQQARTRRPYNTGLRATRRTSGDESSMLTIDITANLNDSIPNEYLLQSRGYTVERLPEITWESLAIDIPNTPLEYSSENRLGLISLDFAENRLEEQGFDTNQLAQDAFGPAATPRSTPEELLAAQGFPDQNILRFDTRHEIAAPLNLGPVNITPYTVGRITAYDTDFDQFDPQGRGIDNDARLWAAAGVRASTAIHTIDNNARSETLDIDRLRHIIEPSLHLWHADADVQQSRLPTYDESVESLAEHSAARIGLRNTWQTKRGTPGRKRSVDWLTLDTDLVLASEDSQTESPINRFNDRRPEQSFLGNDHFDIAAVLAATDAVAVVAETQYDTDDDRFPFTTAGLRLDHGYGHSSYLEYRAVDTPNLDRIVAGARYEFTRKYAAEAEAAWNLNADDVQSIGANIIRRFPQWTLAMSFDLEDTRDTVSFGISLRPVGFAGNDRTRILTHEFPKTAGVNAPTPTSRYSADRIDNGPFNP